MAFIWNCQSMLTGVVRVDNGYAQHFLNHTHCWQKPPYSYKRFKYVTYTTIRQIRTSKWKFSCVHFSYEWTKYWNNLVIGQEKLRKYVKLWYIQDTNRQFSRLFWALITFYNFPVTFFWTIWLEKLHILTSNFRHFAWQFQQGELIELPIKNGIADTTDPEILIFLCKAHAQCIKDQTWDLKLLS